MAQQLKHFFDERVVRDIAQELSSAQSGFDARGFVRDGLEGLADLELTARGWHLAEVMQRYLPPSFPRAAQVILASLRSGTGKSTALPVTDGVQGMEPFRYLPHVFYVAKYGIEYFEPAMALQYELTQRFTAEFSIRPFLERYPEKTYERLREWAGDPNVHVRRLVSEGTRPRLPWAPRLKAFQKDPRPVLELLEQLKDAPERYVQRSVANNLNDIGKDHPDVAVEVCRGWLANEAQGRKGEDEGRRWIVQHALRSLVKGGHPGALGLLGVGTKPDVRVREATFAPKIVNVGGELRFGFVLVGTAKKPQELLVDYAVHFVKASGLTRPKVFKLKRLTLAPGAQVELSSKISFRDMTTRKHRPGRHRIELLINGVVYPLAEFDVAAP